MSYFVLKALVTGVLVAAISELAKKSSLLAAILASLPLTSILALIWLYREKPDVQASISLSTSIFWMVLPSLVFFVVFPLLLKWGFRFYPALLLGCLLMVGVYWSYALLLKRWGVSL